MNDSTINYILLSFILIGVSAAFVNEAQKKWIYGTFYKVCLSVDSEKELLDIGCHAVLIGLSVKYIEETTGFDKPTITCIAIGPDYSSKIDPVTKHLKLL